MPGHSVAPYPAPGPGYGDPSQAPPPAGFNMSYNQGPPPVMYQPGPVVPAAGPEYGGGIAPAPGGPAVPVGVPPGLEYLTQVSYNDCLTLGFNVTVLFM